jgi:DNA-binding beta-propeller fold protein YncE
VQTSNQVVAIDPSTDQVIERHQTPGCEHPHGLLIHPDQHRAFVACQGNDELIIMDMTGMQVTSCVEVGKDPDVLAPDPGLHLVYVAAESGPLAVLRDDATGSAHCAQVGGAECPRGGHSARHTLHVPTTSEREWTPGAQRLMVDLPASP